MYPLSENALSLWMLANHWSRDFPQRPPWQEVFLLLLKSIWRGDLEVIQQPGELELRQRLLETVARTNCYLGVAVLPDGASVVNEQQIGGAPDDTRAYVILPKDRTKWDAAVIDSACSVLADKADLEEFLWQGSPFRSLPISREAFERYCLAKGYALPLFWFGPQRRKVSTAKARWDCEIWLKRLVAAGPKHGGKMALWLEAEAKFPGLSRHAFDEAWVKVAPPSWRRPGARPGPRSSKITRPASR